MSEGLTLSKEQAALLLPLLPAALAQSSSAALASQDATRPVTDGISQYTNAEMFMKKKKNSKSTPAQNYLLVSVAEHTFHSINPHITQLINNHSFYGIRGC